MVAKSNQAIPARTETLVQCELRYEDGSKATKLEGIVNPLATFQEATGLWVVILGSRCNAYAPFGDWENRLSIAAFIKIDITDFGQCFSNNGIILL